MLGHFPTPYPDELFYSLCARYAGRVRYASAKSVLDELFGACTAAAVIDLPNRIGYLAAALPANSSLTADRFIDRHTPLPFFSAFQPPSRVERLRDDMKGNDGTAGYMRSGIMASRVPAADYLRFCPTCRREDTEQFGETYWHRLHQLPRLMVCPTHQTFLENGSVSLRAGRKHLQFIPADQATRLMPAQRVNEGKRDHQTLLQIARNAEWLLNSPSLGISLDSLYGRYLRLLVGRGLATYTGSIHVKELLSEFTSHYSPALLKLLHCELGGREVEKTNWLLRLVRPPKHSQHPLYHLLLIQFFGLTTEEFFRLPEGLTPFGEGPWPCLNPAADHYRESVVTECQLGNRLRYDRPTGRFICVCGFDYARAGPDCSPEDRFRVGRILSFGLVWEAMLKLLWKDSTLSISEIGRRLRVDPLTVRRCAARLELSLSRSDKMLKPLTPAIQLKRKAVSAAWEKKQRACRSKWLVAMKQGRQITLKALRGKLPREYAWLRQHDSEWLKGHKPHPQRCGSSITNVDWKKRDADYATAVRGAASRIKELPGRPVQVTKTAIGRTLGAITLLQHKLHKMPLTAQVLASVLETREQYAIRRIWWAAIKFCQETSLPREWQLISRANVHRLIAIPDIKNTIKSALKRVRLTLSHSPHT